MVTALSQHDNTIITAWLHRYHSVVTPLPSADIFKWWTQEATLSYSHSKKTFPESTLSGNRGLYTTRLASFYPEGNVPDGEFLGAGGLPFLTPKNQINWANTSKTLNDNPRLSFRSIFKPVRNLDVTFEYTFDKKIYDYSWYTGSTHYSMVQGGIQTTPTLDYLVKDKSYTNYNNINLYATYLWNLKDKNHFKFMAGFNQESNYYEDEIVYSYGQAVTEVPSLASGTSSSSANDSYIDYTVRGGFFRVNYDYNDKYLLEVNGRYDGSSKFPKHHRFGFFPSVSAGWNISSEKFLSGAKNWLDALKLRASYGKIGNQNIPAYAYIPTMSISNQYNGWLTNGVYETAMTSLPALVSSSFTWEKVGTFDVGIDFGLFKNRLTGTFDWYVKNTDGMLAPGMEIPAVVGADAPFQNTADLRTRGWDLTINWNDKIGSVSYRIGFNLSDYNTEITKYDSNDAYLLSNFYKGQKLGEIWGYVYDGFYTVDDFTDTSSWQLKEGVTRLDGYNPRPGDVKFKNLRDDDYGTNIITSGNGTLENPGDRKVIGNTTPRYVFGINLGVNYKGFDLSAILTGTGKRDAWIANNLVFPLYPDSKFIALYKGTENYWYPVDAASGDYTAANPNAKYPRIYEHYGNQGSNYRVSDRYLSDASYLRIKNVTLSYSFPKRLVSVWGLSQLKAFLSIENLATFTSLPNGIDPETLSWDYPIARTVSFGVNVTL